MTTSNITKIEAEAQEQRAVADPMVSMIERVAMDPNLPIERLERMMDMKERMEDRARDDEDREAQRAFFAALSKAQAAIPVVLKNKSNEQTRSKYADLAAIEEQAMPVIREHGFAVSAWSVPGADVGMQRVRFRVSHEQGHTDEIEDDFALDGEGIKGNQNKTKLHAKGSTVSYARRYLTTGYFNISTSDDDGNAGGGRAPATISAQQYIALRDKAEEAGVDEAKICLAAGCQDLHQFPASKFEGAMARLDKNLAAKRGGDDV